MKKTFQQIMDARILVRGIQAIIPGGISVKDFSAITKADSQTSQKILEELIQNGIGRKSDGVYDFVSSDRLKFALFALKKGALVEEVSEHIEWKDFEGLVAEILEEKGFSTIRNLILTKPRMEIDVVGTKLGVTMLIDCKHWRRTSPSVFKTITQKQIDRTKHYVAQTHGAVAVPVIVTLYQERIDFVDKVPIVPILQFPGFVDEFYGNLEQVDVIKSN